MNEFSYLHFDFQTIMHMHGKQIRNTFIIILIKNVIFKLFGGHIAKVVKRTLKKDIFCHIHYYMLIQWDFTNSSFTTKGKYASFIIVKNTTLCAHNYDYDGLYTHYFNNNFEKKKQISVQLMSVY